ncbi:hypothetical protein C8Q74DRAFT_1235603 [Fomes fomentarius]|nr:hypothetical protein C8Q74DRAFT_1235603 [Fomes fomentarius]
MTLARCPARSSVKWFPGDYTRRTWLERIESTHAHPAQGAERGVLCREVSFVPAAIRFQVLVLWGNR